MNNNYFEKVLQILFPLEGGYSNRKNDWGGPTNFGITQKTFNYWRDKQKKNRDDVKNISKDEATQIYKDMYWDASGANKLEDPRDAMILFDTAVQYGDATAKKMFDKADKNFYKMLNVRRQKYKDTVEKYPSQKENLQGWLNRVDNLEKEAEKMLKDGFYIPPYAGISTPFDNNYDGNLKVPSELSAEKQQALKNKYQYLFNKTGKPVEVPTLDKINRLNKPFTREQIGAMSTSEFKQNESEIMKQLKNNQIKSEFPDFSKVSNSQDNRIFTREDIKNMTSQEYSTNEHDIMNQLKTSGIPTIADLNNNPNVIYVPPYIKADGTKVSGYYRRLA